MVALEIRCVLLSIAANVILVATLGERGDADDELSPEDDGLHQALMLVNMLRSDYLKVLKEKQVLTDTLALLTQHLPALAQPSPSVPDSSPTDRHPLPESTPVNTENWCKFNCQNFISYSPVIQFTEHTPFDPYIAKMDFVDRAMEIAKNNQPFHREVHYLNSSTDAAWNSTSLAFTSITTNASETSTLSDIPQRRFMSDQSNAKSVGTEPKDAQVSGIKKEVNPKNNKTDDQKALSLNKDVTEASRKPGSPVINKPGSLVARKPGPSLASKAGPPVASKAGPPAASKLGLPAVRKPGAQIARKPGPPVASKLVQRQVARKPVSQEPIKQEVIIKSGPYRGKLVRVKHSIARAPMKQQIAGIPDKKDFWRHFSTSQPTKVQSKDPVVVQIARELIKEFQHGNTKTLNALKNKILKSRVISRRSEDPSNSEKGDTPASEPPPDNTEVANTNGNVDDAAKNEPGSNTNNEANVNNAAVDSASNAVNGSTSSTLNHDVNSPTNSTVNLCDLWPTTEPKPTYKSTLKLYLERSSRLPTPLPKNNAFCFWEPQSPMCGLSL